MSDDRAAEANPPAPQPGRLSRIQARAAGYVGRHPSLVKVLGRMGIYNPGGSINP
jgi:hypothetical protein